MGAVRNFQVSLVLACLTATPPAVAQTLTPQVWDPYTDRFGLIHTQPVDDLKIREPKSGNGLLYTAEACVIMELSNVRYDREKIAAGVKASQVKPGLFGRGPTKLNDRNEHDDYWGLGALAAICGFRDVARDILAYGRGPDQSSGSKVYEFYNKTFGQLSDKLNECRIVPYDYNNASPHPFTWHSWLGKDPSLITHLKIAAGEQPSSDELAFWGAALIFSATQEKIGFEKEDKMGSWLIAWLQVLTYQMSRYHSSAADYAVLEWRKQLRSQFPQGGIKQVMREYLKDPNKENPFGLFIDNFEQARNPNPVMVDSPIEPENLIRILSGFLTNDCGPNNVKACVDYRNYSPANAAAQINKASQLAERVPSEIEKRIARFEANLDAPADMLKFRREFYESFNKQLTEVEATHAGLTRQLDDAITRKKRWIETFLDKTAPPGICVRSPCRWCPPIHVPCPLANHPIFEEFVQTITRVETALRDTKAVVDQVRPNVEAARRTLDEETREFEEHVRSGRAEILRLRGELTKARAAVEALKDYGKSVVKTITPCS